MEIKSTKDLRQGRLTWFDYGMPGSGKTHLISTFPKVLIGASEEGLSGLKGRDIHYTEISSYSDWKQFIDFVVNDDKEHESIAIDSMTALQYLVMNDILETVKVKRTSPDTPQISDYGVFANRVRNSIEYLKKRPVHIILTALPALTKDEVTGGVIGEPNLIGALRRELPGWLDLYTYHECEVNNEGQKVHRIWTATKGRWISRDRSGKLPLCIEDPSFDKVYSTLQGS